MKGAITVIPWVKLLVIETHGAIGPLSMSELLQTEQVTLTLRMRSVFPKKKLLLLSQEMNWVPQWLLSGFGGKHSSIATGSSSLNIWKHWFYVKRNHADTWDLLMICLLQEGKSTFTPPAAQGRWNLFRISRSELSNHHFPVCWQLLCGEAKLHIPVHTKRLLRAVLCLCVKLF